MNQKTALLTSFFSLSFITLFGTTAFAHGPSHSGSQFAPYTNDSLRLIETKPNQRQWMRPDDVLKLSERQHSENGFCGGFMDVTDYPNEKHEEVRSFYSFGNRPIQEQATIRPLIEATHSEQMVDTIKSLSSFKNRYFRNPTGVDSSKWIETQFRMLSMNRSDIQIETVQHNFIQPSVIARILGKGPLAHEKVIIGGHADSISGWGGGLNMNSPGSDDNASGIATVLEAFRVIAQSGYQPSRTIEFMAYAGEEAGLLGSQDIAQSYKKAGENVIAVMQLDMTMFAGSGNNLIHFVMDNINNDLTAFTQRLIQEYLGIPVVNTQCGYACSDHASWTKAGYASVFPFEAAKDKMNSKIHTPSDVLSILDAELGLQFTKLAVSFAVELSARQ